MMIDDTVWDDIPEIWDTALEPTEVIPPDCLYWVGVYLVDRAYGGPEEGGWYYDCGELVTDRSFYEGHSDYLPRTFLDEKQAHAFAKTIDKWLEESHNVGRREISSVLSEGRYYAMVMEGILPHHYPERKPHYE